MLTRRELLKLGLVGLPAVALPLAGLSTGALANDSLGHLAMDMGASDGTWSTPFAVTPFTAPLPLPAVLSLLTSLPPESPTSSRRPAGSSRAGPGGLGHRRRSTA